MRRPAMMGHAPSYTWRPASSSLKPRCRNCLKKLPDCETPRPMTHLIRPASGLAVPKSSCASFLKNVARSRNAAKPTPSTYGSVAVNTTWYNSVASKPFLRQICVGSGVPGNGCAASHLAHCQSEGGMVEPTVTMPSTVSCVCVVNVACVVSRVAGLYGRGLFCTRIGCELAPLRFTMRPRTVPVMDEPSRCLAIGTTTNSLPVSVWEVAPELSPCQPLERPTSPALRSAATIVTLPPRFGTSCHISPLMFSALEGRISWNVALYSTLPLAFLGARRMSWIISFRSSRGSSSPKAIPVRRLSGPASPKGARVASGSTGVLITILVTRASAGVHASSAAMAAAPVRARNR